ncbi:MAG: hypothetical protein MHM6MM_000623 [Cercozoa sp. M6MM]
MQSRKSRSDVASNDNSDSIQDEKHDQVPHRSVEQDTSHGTAAFEIGLSENEIRKKKVRQQLLQRALLDEQISERQRIMEARKKAELGHPEVEIPKDEEQTRPSIFSFTGSAPASPLSAIAPIDKRQESTPKKYEKLRRQRKENTNVWIKQQRTPLQKSTGTGISPVVQEGLPDPEVQSTFLAAFRDTINATVATLREAIRQSADASKSTTWVPQHRDTEPKAPEIEPSQIVDEAVQKLKSELSAQQAVHSAELDSIRSQLDELVKAEVKRQEEQCRTEQLQRVEVDENVMRPVDRELSSHKIFLKNANTAHSSPLRPTSTRTVSSDIRDNRAPKFSQEAPLRRRKGSASRRSSVFKPSQRNSDSSIPVERYVVNEQSEASRSSIENMLEAETKLVPVEEAAVVESSFGGETSQARSEGVLWPVASQDDEECSFDVLELDRSMRRKLSAALEIAKVIGPEMCEQPSQVPQYAVLPLSEQGQVKAASAMRAYARRFLRNEVGTTGANFADNEAPDDPRVDALLRALASEEDDDLHFAQQAESVFDEVSVSDADDPGYKMEKVAKLLLCQRQPTLRAATGVVVKCRPLADSTAQEKRKKGKKGKNAKVSLSYEVMLSDDATVLYAEGGGQPADYGTIGNAVVTDVYRVANEQGEMEVWHKTDRPVEEGAELEVCVNWRRRFDHAQCHTAQHVLSACAMRSFGLSTSSWWLSTFPQDCFVDLACPSADIDLEALVRQIEQESNAVIREAHRVQPHFVDSETAAEELSRTHSDSSLSQLLQQFRAVYTDGKGVLRIMRIAAEDSGASFDWNACGGTHVSCTSELQQMRVSKYEVKGDILRLYFAAGERMRAQFDEMTRILSDTCSAFGDGVVPDTLANKAAKSVASLKSAKASAKYLSVRAMESDVAALRKQLETQCVAALACPGATMPYLRDCAAAVLEDNSDKIVLLVGGVPGDNDESAVFLLWGNPEHVTTRAVGKTVSELLKGRGGGRPGSLQGVVGCFDAAAEALPRAVRCISDVVLSQSQ